MTFETFSNGNSPFHRADTRVKLISGLAITLVLALCQDFPTASTGLILAISTALFARLPWRSLVLRLLVVNSFTLFLWLTLPLTYPGTPVFSLGPLEVSREGVQLATLITLKTNAIIIFCMALLATSSIADIGYGLGRLRFPPKLCLLLLFSYRYIFVIYQEYQRLIRAAQLRSFQPGTNLHTYKTYAYLFGMTLVKSCHRADRVNNAMLLRGFHGKFYSLHDNLLRGSDIALAVALFAISAILAYLEWGLFQ